jgi:glycosyltransferase involved in cell wall biosynthesis
MKASIILPVYNGAGTIKETLDSVLTQTEADFELLISNDASKDRSLEIIQEYGYRDSRIRIFDFNPGKGLAASLNHLIESAASEYIFRMDHDDVCLPRRLETQIRFLDEHPEVAVVGSNVFHMGRTPDHDRLVELPESSDQIKETLKKHNCLYHPSVAFRRSVILGLGGYRKEFKNAEDYDLWLRVSRHHELQNVREPLIRYRFSTGGMTLSRKWEQLFFVCLAQASNAEPTEELSNLWKRAEKMQENLQKDYFLNEVYKGTIRELQLLGWNRQAFGLLQQMISDVGAERTGLQFLRMVSNILRSS